MCDLGDYLEPFEFSAEYERKARKPHLCNLCEGSINPGEKYIKQTVKFMGEVSSENLCAACVKDRDIFADAHGGIFSTPSSTKELIEECLSEREDFKDMLKWARMLKRINGRREARA